MTHPRKIVLIGATSQSFGLSALRDVIAEPGLAGGTLVLVGRNRDSLARMAELARIVAQASGARIAVEQTTDRRAALDGAQFVVNATAVDRLRMWRLDFDVPRKYGIRHTLGENGGPGGLFFTLRTLPLVFDIVRDIEAACPDAWFVNLSNPESRIILALGKYSRVRAVGLCHGILDTKRELARLLGMPEDSIEVWGAGLNHFQWLLHIRDRATGEDLYPALRAAEARHDPAFAPLTRRLFRAFGYWPTCSDHHLGEYLAYGWEAGETGYDFAADARDREAFRRTAERVVADPSQLPREWLGASGERIGALIGAAATNERRVLESAVVRNDGAIANLAAEAAVEVPVSVDAAGVHPISLGPLPDAIAKLLAMQVSVQQLAVEAAVRASKEIALQALLIDPVVNSSDAALRILDELWEANRPFIRPCL